MIFSLFIYCKSYFILIFLFLMRLQEKTTNKRNVCILLSRKCFRLCLWGDIIYVCRTSWCLLLYSSRRDWPWTMFSRSIYWTFLQTLQEKITHCGGCVQQFCHVSLTKAWSVTFLAAVPCWHSLTLIWVSW